MGEENGAQPARQRFIIGHTSPAKMGEWATPIAAPNRIDLT